MAVRIAAAVLAALAISCSTFHAYTFIQPPAGQIAFGSDIDERSWTFSEPSR